MIEVSSELDTELDMKELLVDCTASCLASKTKYFSTKKEEQPWITFDLGEIRTMYGLRVYLRVDGGERNLEARQSTFRFTELLNVQIMRLSL